MVDELASGAWPTDVPTAWTGGAATPARRGRGLPPGHRAAHRPGAADRGPRQDRRLHRRVRDQPGHRRGDPGVRRRLRADGLRHRRDHGGARPGRARLGVRRSASACRSCAPCSRRRAGRARRITGDGPAINSANGEVSLDGLGVDEAKARIIELAGGAGRRPAHRHLQAARLAVQPPALLGRAVPDRLRRARPAGRAARLDAAGRAARGRRLLAADVRRGRRRTPSRSRRWRARPTGSRSTLDLGDGPKPYRRETNTMPQWAGSCWYELRYLDPTNAERFVDPDVERYWMGPQGDGHTGGVDLYVGGVEHAVLHLLYARFWHKVLFDLGHVSSERAVPPAVQPGHDPGVRLHRRARRLRAAPTRSSARRSTAGCSPTRASRSRASTGRWARA